MHFDLNAVLFTAASQLERKVLSGRITLGFGVHRLWILVLTTNKRCESIILFQIAWLANVTFRLEIKFTSSIEF